MAIVVQTPSDEAAQPRDDDPLLQAEITGTQTPVTKLFISRYEKLEDLLHSIVWVPTNDVIIFNSFDLEYPYTKEQSPPLLLYAWLLKEKRKIRLIEAPAPAEVPAWYILPTISPSGKKLAYLKVWVEGKINVDDEFLLEIYLMDLISSWS